MIFSLLTKIDVAIRFSLMILVIGIFSVPFMIVFLLLLPWRKLRIRMCWLFQQIVGWTGMIAMRSRMTTSNRQRIMDSFPAIYVFNHTSNFDLFLMALLAPMGAVVIAKKEIAYIPLFGWLALISGHLLIDRKRHGGAVAAMQATAREVEKYNLAMAISPEGTRSSDGRLLPFKKGFAHMALATRLPIVPIILHNVHERWPRGSFVNSQPMRHQVDVLEAIDTSSWDEQNIDEHIAHVRQIMIGALGERQKPLDNTD